MDANQLRRESRKYIPCLSPARRAQHPSRRCGSCRIPLPKAPLARLERTLRVSTGLNQFALVLHFLKCYSTDQPSCAERPAEPAVPFDHLVQLLCYTRSVEQRLIDDP